ncbi:MAG: hypothetical protein WAR37_02015 [Candidatus Microsaccharimonas sp.]
MIKNNIATLLETEMERKDFLKIVALGAVAATGVTQILKAMTPGTARPRVSTGPASYGTSAYGGALKK